MLVDRIALAPEQRARVIDALEIGYRESGEAVFEIVPRDADGGSSSSSSASNIVPTPRPATAHPTPAVTPITQSVFRGSLVDQSSGTPVRLTTKDERVEVLGFAGGTNGGAR